MQYATDEFGHHDIPGGVVGPPSGAGGARYASPKTGGGLYQADPYFDPSGAGSWYVPPNGAGPGGYVQGGPGGGANAPYHHQQQQQQPQPGPHGLHHMSHSPHISSPPNHHHHHPDPYGAPSGPNGGGPVLVGATGVPHMDGDLVVSRRKIERDREENLK